VASDGRRVAFGGDVHLTIRLADGKVSTGMARRIWPSPSREAASAPDHAVAFTTVDLVNQLEAQARAGR
jgi:hypothetical protein